MTRINSKKSGKHTRRRCKGSILIVVLVCLAAASTILLGLITFSIRNRSQVRTELQLAQTNWLLDAAIGHAVHTYRENPEFDRLDLTITGLSDRHTATVKIIRLANEPDGTTVDVIARIIGRATAGITTQRSQRIVIPTEPRNNTNDPDNN